MSLLHDVSPATGTSDLPTGTVTFLFTDVEGSTRLLDELGADAYAEALAEHRRVIREGCTAHGGVEVDTQGEAFFYAFPTAPGAVDAASALTDSLAPGPMRVRVGVHTGTPLLTDEGYVGADVHRAARIAAAGHGGQVLISQTTATLVGHDLDDLGEQRLKDLSAPERIFQLGTHAFPPLNTLGATNLPIPATPFLGRERELDEVVGLLQSESVRLLTLSGPPGTGKTRLALQSAGSLAERYPDGVYWIPLAPLTDPNQVLERAAQVVGAKRELPRHIADRRMLLVFDNFEHVSEAGSELASLLGDCTRLELLVTSREPLHLAGELEYPVPPFTSSEGVAFFVSRARTVRPDFAPDAAVEQICRRLDDLPLALELAAVRVKSLSTLQILGRLEERLSLLTAATRDVPARHRTLRATLEWSYELLSAEEQLLFRRLAVFAGGCTLEAAEEATDADLDTLQSLIDKSLVRFSQERYWMLQTIREYAGERLRASSEAAELEQRHALWYLALAQEAGTASVRGEEQVSWLERLEREHDNMRTARRSFAGEGDGDHLLQLAAHLWYFRYIRGYVQEGRRDLVAALGVGHRQHPDRLRALEGAAQLSQVLRDPAAARSYAEEMLDLAVLLDDEWGQSHALNLLGNVESIFGDPAAARELFERSARYPGADSAAHYALAALGMIALVHDRDLETARRYFEQALVLNEAIGHRQLISSLLAELGIVAMREGDEAGARAMLARSLEVGRALGDENLLARQALPAVAALVARDDPRAAVTLLGAARDALATLGLRPGRLSEELFAEAELTARSAFSQREFAEAWEEGREMEFDDAVALAVACTAHPSEDRDPSESHASPRRR